MSGFWDDILAKELGHVQLDPVTLRRIVLAMTRAHFSSAENYGPLRGAYENFVWKPGQASPVLIELDHLDDPAKEDKAPSIYVGTGDISLGKDVLNYFQSPTPTRSGTNYTSRAACPVILECVSSNPDESLSLATLACGFFAMARQPTIDRIHTLKDIQILQISKPAKVSKSDNKRAVKSNLTLLFVYDFNWTTEVESHTIKTISLAGFKQMAGL